MSLQEQLHELFLLDQQLRGLRNRLDAGQSRQRAQQNKLVQLQQQQQELSHQLRQTQVNAQTLEKQSGEMEARINELRGRMNNVTSNKEYSALLVEVNTLKVDKSKIEDQALEQMNEVDTLKQRVTDIEQKIDDQKKLVSGADNEVDSARAEVGDRLDEVASKRQAAAEKVPADARAVFERLADSYEGEALAEVEEANRRRMEYNCGGCYMSLPIERVNGIMMRTNELVTCPNCNRILYMKPELKSALSGAK
ncbi:zinc ribbon domain-containing protein [Phycisphaerales bacterium AB-hyl4]|uniref:Zinc ribbon domain-containing protein n=1 Tax=Natronomicrosphaera hydrolytica TaxID=3242702 RepID=A0ABV4UA15_9BACT